MTDTHVTPGMLEAAAEGRLNENEVVALDRTPADEAMDRWRAGSDLLERPERLPEADAWARMAAMATSLARSKLMPRHIRDSKDPEADLMVILLAAHDLGLSATVALQKVNVIEGKPAMAAELMRMLVRRDGHELWTEVDRDEHGRPVGAVAVGKRKEGDREYAASFTLEDAAEAGLITFDDAGNIRARTKDGVRKPWESYTEDMLIARATSRLCRRVFEDCLAGVSYTPEELGDIAVENEAEPEPAWAPANTLTELRETIAKRTPAVQDEIRRRWKDARLGSLTLGGQAPTLLLVEVQRARALISDAEKDTPADAEIVPETHPFEGADTAETCATCDQGREHPNHPQVEPEAVSEAQEPTGAISGREIGEWVAGLKLDKVREVLIHAGLDIDGDEGKLRVRLYDHQVAVSLGQPDTRACSDCGGYPFPPIPPGREACECSI